MSVKSLVLALIITLGLAVPVVPAQADQHENGPAAAMVFIVDAGGKANEFMAFLDRAEAIAEKLDAKGKRRVFRNSFAGPQSNAIIVSVEFPNMVQLAKSSQKLSASPEWQKLGADLAAAGIRMMSVSIMQEM